MPFFSRPRVWQERLFSFQLQYTKQHISTSINSFGGCGHLTIENRRKKAEGLKLRPPAFTFFSIFGLWCLRVFYCLIPFPALLAFPVHPDLHAPCLSAEPSLVLQDRSAQPHPVRSPA